LEQRRRFVISELDRGYADFLSGKMSDEFWTRRSQEWDAELQIIEDGASAAAAALPSATAARILENSQTGRIFLQIPEFERTAETTETVRSNCT
jgi:hypothetical protein